MKDMDALIIKTTVLKGKFEAMATSIEPPAEEVISAVVEEKNKVSTELKSDESSLAERSRG